MKLSSLFVFAALIGSTAQVQAQSLLQQSIVTPDKAVAVVNQTLEGTWLSELRPPGLPAAAPAIPQIVTFFSNGTVVASSADGTTSAAHGVWVRVGDRKFLMTVFLFNYDASRALTTISKGRVNIQMSLDGQTIKTTNEAVVMDRNGKVMATVPGGTAFAVRLSPEIPADFYDFQKVQ
jgi:hypothetical protein